MIEPVPERRADHCPAVERRSSSCCCSSMSVSTREILRSSVCPTAPSEIRMIAQPNTIIADIVLPPRGLERGSVAPARSSAVVLIVTHHVSARARLLPARAAAYDVRSALSSEAGVRD